ncbi:keratin, type I cytoskeletal 18-like [Triplophysa rosa]|uniref:IF rod domain-containing protein n=1 Tax=Triplophysa rosa TaxID=992332 RepID=A0A9W7T8T2_TRIRA|nr:keratin, type I cytoskeletal 18-like [Triplophysa rosa]KAI7793873.1 hypothetical protein IRJ41_003104 [Triplophysa rosa]
MKNFSSQSRRIRRMASESDLSILKSSFSTWSSPGKRGFDSREFLGKFDNAQMRFGFGNEKITMQILNDRLASYLEIVKSLEKANSELELQIHQFLEKKCPDACDYNHYLVIIDKLRKEIQEMTLGLARVDIQIDNSKLAAEDFKLKFEHELSIRQWIEADINTQRRKQDDINMARMHLENEVKRLKVELIDYKKQHQLDVSELRDQIEQAGVQVHVDAPIGQDLIKIMEEMRANYEKIILKNKREVKKWHETKITEVHIQVSENTAALKEANTQASESRKKMKSLEIERQSLLGTRTSLEEALREMRLRYAVELEQYNAIIVLREAELRQLREDTQNQSRDYQALLNIKMKLEDEIETYRRLLNGDDFEQLSEEEKKTRVTTITQNIVNGQVVSTSSETKEKVV